MKPCEFTEFQFTYSVCREIEDGNFSFPGYKIEPMPEWINQVVEGVKGYDVAFKPVYLQFKIPILIESSHGEDWQHYGEVPYYQFNLRNRQHHVLKRLAEIKENGVFYCAPDFIERKKYAAYHNGKTVSENSVFLDCEKMADITDSEHHRITYLDNNIWLQHSDIYEGKVIKGKEQLLDNISKKEFFNKPEDYLEVHSIFIKTRHTDLNGRLNSIEKYLVRSGFIPLILHRI